MSLENQYKFQVSPKKQNKRRGLLFFSAGTSKKVENKKSETNIKLLNVVMQLRKCCNHPYLLSYPLDPVTQQYRIDEELITSSGKLLVLERLLPALKKNGHKVSFDLGKDRNFKCTS